MALTQTAVLWLGTFALLISYLGIARANGRKSQIISLGFALVFWAAFALNATNMNIYDGATVYSIQSQSLTLLGVLGAGMSLVLLFEAVMRGVTDA